MNQNIILAILVTRNIVTLEEATKIAEHLSNKPQSTYLTDAVTEVTHILNPLPVSSAPIPANVGPEQRAEQEAAQAAPVIPPDNEKTPDELKSQAADSTAGAMDSPAATGMDNAVSTPSKPTADVSAAHVNDADDTKADTGSKKAGNKSSSKTSKK